MADIDLIINIPEEIYQRYKKVWQKRKGSIPESCIAFGTPLPKGTSIPFLMHKELGIPISECQEAYDVAIDYLRNKANVRG